MSKRSANTENGTNPPCSAIGTAHADTGMWPNTGKTDFQFRFFRRTVVIDTTRFFASPLGRAAIASILALTALSGVAMSHRAVAAPLIFASPAAITGELA